MTTLLRLNLLVPVHLSPETVYLSTKVNSIIKNLKYFLNSVNYHTKVRFACIQVSSWKQDSLVPKGVHSGLPLEKSQQRKLKPESHTYKKTYFIIPPPKSNYQVHSKHPWQWPLSAFSNSAVKRGKYLIYSSNTAYTCLLIVPIHFETTAPWPLCGIPQTVKAWFWSNKVIGDLLLNLREESRL